MVSLRLGEENQARVIAMDRSSGRKTGGEDAAFEAFGAFVDEVLSAGWLPRPEACPETIAPVGGMPSCPVEPDEFLRNMYRCQE